MCQKCNQFFANSNLNNHCSKCYKELDIKEMIKKENSKVPVAIEDKEPVIEEKTIIEQTDHSKCWQCAKKAGMFSFKCKCAYTFCKKHRLPEKHSCNFDFVKDGKNRLANNNKSIQRAKIEEI